MLGHMGRCLIQYSSTYESLECSDHNDNYYDKHHHDLNDLNDNYYDNNNEDDNNNDHNYNDHDDDSDLCSVCCWNNVRWRSYLCPE